MAVWPCMLPRPKQDITLVNIPITRFLAACMRSGACCQEHNILSKAQLASDAWPHCISENVPERCKLHRVHGCSFMPLRVVLLLPEISRHVLS